MPLQLAQHGEMESRMAWATLTCQMSWAAKGCQTRNHSGLGDNVGSIAGDTCAIKDSMDIAQEDLKYLRDIAEQEAVNRYTLAEVKVEQTNHNNINGSMDLDGVVSGLTDAVNEAVANITEGVHA